LEFVGDLERAFASAIYPNRVLVGIVGLAILGTIGLRARSRRWDRAARQHPIRTALAARLTLAVIGPLGWYLGSPLFLSTSIDEAPPVAAGVPSRTPASLASAEPTAERSESEPSATALPAERAGSFEGADEFHFGEGTARLIETAPGQFTVRFEDFAVRNGPDLYVYLSSDAGGYAEGAIELGRMKADRGNQNYDIPAGIDLSNVRSVVVWCKQFAVLFASAELS
jgi:hypothetical protein